MTSQRPRSHARRPGAQPLPAHQRGLRRRLLAALGDPRRRGLRAAVALLVAIIVVEPELRRPERAHPLRGRTAPIAIAAMGQYFVIVGGEFDLSMGAVDRRPRS